MFNTLIQGPIQPRHYDENSTSLISPDPERVTGRRLKFRVDWVKCQRPVCKIPTSAIFKNRQIFPFNQNGRLTLGFKDMVQETFFIDSVSPLGTNFPTSTLLRKPYPMLGGMREPFGHAHF